MSYSKEMSPQSFLSDQVKSGLKKTASTFDFYGIENPNINQPGRVEFASGATILNVEDKNFRSQNNILGLLGDESGALQEMVFNPDPFCTNIGSTILVLRDYAQSLNKLNGFNLKDRTKASDYEIAVFNVIAAKQLEISSKSARAEKGSATFLEEYQKFLNEFVRIHPEMEQSQTLLKSFDEITHANRKSLNVKIKGLQISVFNGQQSLFTINKVFDQAIRFVLVSKMYSKYESLMSQKYTWFSPSDRMKTGITLDSQMEMDKEELFSVLSFKDTKKLLELYTSGEMGLKYLDLIPEKTVEITSDLVEGLSTKMRSSNLTMPEIDYSGYQPPSEGQPKDVFVSNEFEELTYWEEDTSLRQRKQRTRKTEEQ